MNPNGTAEAWFEQWRSLLGSVGVGATESGIPGLQDASAAFERFAADFAAVSGRRASGHAPGSEELAASWRGFAERFVTQPLPIPPTIGLSAPLSAALAAWSRVQAQIAADIAARFAARLTGTDPPRTLRSAFDRWIECAEAAFQAAAHDEAFGLAQARLLNELVALRAEQQQLLDRASRLAGMPTRTEVDALHDSVQALRAALASSARPAPAARTRARARGKAPARSRLARAKKPRS